MNSEQKKTSDFSTTTHVACATCGAEARRDTAKFCAACGQSFPFDYAPLDNLRASYDFERQNFSFDAAPHKTDAGNRLFEKNRNNAAITAMAFAVYALVPYLGILFCPGALLMGGIGLAISYQKPQLGGRQTAAHSILLGFIILGIQLFLWWLLYIIPELRRF